MEPQALLQKLIQFNTTNPPGSEKDCILFIDQILKESGFRPLLLSKAEDRPNLIVKLEGTGEAPPFLMQGHVDVVSVDGQDWKLPPFAGEIHEGCIWGRGALDMKGGVAMMLSALILAKERGIKPKGDILLAVVADEEVEGEYGARYLVEEHAGLFQNVKYAIGELGGFTTYVGDKKLYPIMISEKQVCSIRAKIKGPAGHGSLPVKNGSVSKLGRFLCTLHNKRLPVHITEPAKVMIDAMAKALPFPNRFILKQLLHPVMTDRVLNGMGEKLHLFDPLLHHTVNATIIKGGHKINVVPSEVTVELDGRILPGFGADDLIGELQALAGDEVEFEVTKFVPGPVKIDMGFFNTLSAILCDADREAAPVPFIISGSTDARYFSTLGIQTYGYLPMQLPKGMDFARLIHAANERIPLDALTFGTNAILEVIKRYK